MPACSPRAFPIKRRLAPSPSEKVNDRPFHWRWARAADLITVRGRDLIARCPVCLYAGSLVPKAILDYCPAGARVVDTAPMALDEIVAEYVAAAEAGLDVARLHSGDLSVWSALGEQTRRLDALGIPYTVTPGVPAFAAAAAALGRELTLPEVAQSVVLTRTPGRASAMPPTETLPPSRRPEPRSRSTFRSTFWKNRSPNFCPSMAQVVRPPSFTERVGPRRRLYARLSAISWRRSRRRAQSSARRLSLWAGRLARRIFAKAHCTTRPINAATGGGRNERVSLPSCRPCARAVEHDDIERNPGPFETGAAAVQPASATSSPSRAANRASAFLASSRTC